MGAFRRLRFEVHVQDPLTFCHCLGSLAGCLFDDQLKFEEKRRRHASRGLFGGGRGGEGGDFDTCSILQAS